MSLNNITSELELELEESAKNESEHRTYPWLKDAEGLSWQKFSEAFPKHKLWLYTLLDISPEKKGWQRLAQTMGLKSEEIMWCEKYCGTAGPTSSVFTKLVQKKSVPPLHIFLHHLLYLERHDLLSRIPWQTCIEELKEQSIKDPITSSPLLTTLSLNGRISERPESLQQAVRSKRPYTASVLMLFSSDAKEFALQVCKQLRQSTERRGRIGVLLLSEQRHVLLTDTCSALYKWFKQVDILVPILTPMFLHDITQWSVGPDGSEDHRQEAQETALHHRYLYRLAMDQYLANFSRNIRCRPICPETFAAQVVSNEDVLNQGLLQVVTVVDNYSPNQTTNESVEDFAKMLAESPRMQRTR